MPPRETPVRDLPGEKRLDVMSGVAERGQTNLLSCQQSSIDVGLGHVTYIRSGCEAGRCSQDKGQEDVTGLFAEVGTPGSRRKPPRKWLPMPVVVRHRSPCKAVHHVSKLAGRSCPAQGSTVSQSRSAG